MGIKGIKGKNNKGFTFSEALMTVAILAIAIAIVIPSLLIIQRKLRQKELDSKAEIIYVAAQNQLSKLKASGNTSVYSYNGTGNGVSQMDGIPGDAEEGKILSGEICYTSSEYLSSSSSAASAILNEETIDEDVRGHHWVIEYSPESATVYAVFYSEKKVNAAEAYVSDFSTYDVKYRDQKQRLNAGARVGYYGGSGVADFSATHEMEPKIVVSNGEKLTATLSCVRPSGVQENLVFLVVLKDTEGNVYSKYYTANESISSSTNKNDYEVDQTTLKRSGRTFSMELTLDDLSSEDTRFVKLYGNESGHNEQGLYSDRELAAGTALTIELYVTCPDNLLVNQDTSATETTNSLFSDSSNAYGIMATNQTMINDTAIISCGRHLQNLDSSSGVSPKVLYAALNSDINFTDDAQNDADWYSSYSAEYFNGLTNTQTDAVGNQTGQPNFKPIHNEHLLVLKGSYDRSLENTTVLDINGSEQEETQFYIIGLNIDTSKTKEANAGLFGTMNTSDTESIVCSGSTVLPFDVSKSDNDEITYKAGEEIPSGTSIEMKKQLKDLRLIAAKVISNKGSAGSLIGELSMDSATASAAGQNLLIEGCGSYFEADYLTGMTNKDVQINGEYAGGLIGMVSGGKVVVKESFAATVIGDKNASSCGGLIGDISSTSAKVLATESYADNYLTGKILGGIVGESKGNVNLTNVYSAGFLNVTADFDETKLDTGYSAGLFAGSKGTMKNCYTICSGLTDDDSASSTEYYSTAMKSQDVSATNTYYVIKSDEPVEGTEIIDADMTSAQLKNKLGDAFQTDTSDTLAYNLMDQGLKSYTYPCLKNLPHYCDWEASYQEGALVYYEKYSDGTYGFSGANVDELSYDKEPVGDGYGIVYRSSETAKNIHVSIKNPVTGNEIGSQDLTNSSTHYNVYGSKGNYRVYPLSKDIVNTSFTNDKSYYQKAEIVEQDGATDYYFFVPHFADTVVYMQDASADIPSVPKTISIRTARQLYCMSLYYGNHNKKYKGYVNTTKNSTYAQGTDLDYATYEWSAFYKSNTNSIKVQKPIGTGTDKVFSSTYNGYSYEIRHISFAANGEYVGFTGYNSGTIRNVILTNTYREGDSIHYYVQHTGGVSGSVYMGVVAGANAGTIDNTAVAGYCMTGTDGSIRAYENSYLYAGIFVGRNGGKITNSSAESPEVSLSSSNYANVQIGGFAGNNSGSGSISNCYVHTYLKVVSSRGGQVILGGFAANNAGNLRNSYCMSSMNVSGESAIGYGFAPVGGSVSGCYYLNDGTYSFINDHLYSYNADEDISSATAKTYSELKEMGKTTNVTADHTHACACTDEAAYPFRAVVKNVRASSTTYLHYGDWELQAHLGTVGAFYWEYEKGGNEGYHFTYLGTDEDSIKSGSTLCTAHDDNGVISAYGYGYYAAKDSFDSVKATYTNLEVGSSYNKEASLALEKQMSASNSSEFTFRAYTSRTESGADGDYLYLSGTTTCKDGTMKLSFDGESYQFVIAPFFANSIQFVNAGEASLTASDGTVTDYSKAPGESEENQYEIRSAAQLQYLNWNNSTDDTESYLQKSWFNNVNTGIVSAAYQTNTKAISFPYLAYAYCTNTSGTNAVHHSAKYYWNQSHDLNAKMKKGDTNTFTPIGSLYDSNYGVSVNNSYVYTDYFNGQYCGNSYKIMNLEIDSTGQSVGMFSVTIGAKIDSLILYSDSNNNIKTNSAGAGWYNLGSVVGTALAGSDSIPKMSGYGFTNCAVAGYTVQDARGAGGYGGANIGGFVGLTNLNLSKCSAVNNVREDCTYSDSDRNNRIGGMVGNFRGSTLSNCYSGGSISSTTNNKTKIHMAGLVGGYFMREKGNMAALFGTIVTKPTIKDCYTYADMSDTATLYTRRPVASSADYSQIDCFTVTNCYYYPPTSVTYKQVQSYSDGNAVKITYDQLAGITNLTSGSYKNQDIITALNEGTSGSWANVTTVDASGTAVDGRYSFPGSNEALEGKNYPFPTIITQQDLSFGEMVNVHYGEWPLTKPHWTKGRANADLFTNMEDDGYAYATLTFSNVAENASDKLPVNLGKDDFTISVNQGTDEGDEEDDQDTEDIDDTGDTDESDSSGEDSEATVINDEVIAEIDNVAYDSANALYTVRVKLLKGDRTVTVAVKDNQGNDITCSLSITAALTASANPQELTISEYSSANTKLSLKAANENESGVLPEYSVNDNVSWTLNVDEGYEETLVDLKQKDTSTNKNVWTITNNGASELTLTARGSYTYPKAGAEDAETYTATVSILVKDPNFTTTLSSPKTAKQTSPEDTDADTDADIKANKKVDEQKNSLTLMNGSKEAYVYSMNVKAASVTELGQDYVAPEREGWILDGWYTLASANGGTKILNADGTVADSQVVDGYLATDGLSLTGDKILYARWSKEISVWEPLSDKENLEDGQSYLLADRVSEIAGDTVYLLSQDSEIGQSKTKIGEKAVYDNEGQPVTDYIAEEEAETSERWQANGEESWAFRNEKTGDYLQVKAKDGDEKATLEMVSEKDAESFQYDYGKLYSKDGYVYREREDHSGFAISETVNYLYLYRLKTEYIYSFLSGEEDVLATDSATNGGLNEGLGAEEYKGNDQILIKLENETIKIKPEYETFKDLGDFIANDQKAIALPKDCSGLYDEAGNLVINQKGKVVYASRGLIPTKNGYKLTCSFVLQAHYEDDKTEDAQEVNDNTQAAEAANEEADEEADEEEVFQSEE